MSLSTLARELQQEQLTRKQEKLAEETLKAVKELNSQLEKSGKESSGVGALIGDKLSGIKNMFNPAYLMKMLGAKMGGFSGDLINSLAESIDSKKQAKEKQEKDRAKFVQSFLENDVGIKATEGLSEKESVEVALKAYEKKLAIEKEISRLQEKRERIREQGLKGLSTKDAATLKSLETRLAAMFDDTFGENEREDEERPVVKKKSNEGAPLASEGLVPVQEDNSEDIFYQLVDVEERLKEISAKLDVDQEAALESRIKVPQIQGAQAVSGDGETGDSFMTKVMGFVGGMMPLGAILGKLKLALAGIGALFTDIPKIISGVGSALSTGLSVIKSVIGFVGKIGAVIMKFLPILAKLAGPAALVAGAAAAGYAAGSFLNDRVINPLVEKFTGEEGATLGTAAYDLIHGDEATGGTKPSLKKRVSRFFGFGSDEKEEESVATIKRVENQTRQAMNNQVTESEQRLIEARKAEAAKTAAPTVVTSQINNSSTQQTIVNKPRIRPDEPSLMYHQGAYVAP